MTNDKTNQTDSDSTDPTDKELAEIYRLALFSEEFQSQRKEDLLGLSSESIKQLKDEDQQYMDDMAPPKQMTERVWQKLQDSHSPVKSKTWWRKLFSSSEKDKSKSSPRSFPFSMGFQIPVSVTAGLVFGILIGMQMVVRMDNIKQDPYSVTRGGPTAIIEGTPDSLKLSPIKWLHAIAKLIEEGKVEEAQVQLRAFASRYPDFEMPNINGKN